MAKFLELKKNVGKNFRIKNELKMFEKLQNKKNKWENLRMKK